MRFKYIPSYKEQKEYEEKIDDDIKKGDNMCLYHAFFKNFKERIILGIPLSIVSAFNYADLNLTFCSKAKYGSREKVVHDFETKGLVDLLNKEEAKKLTPDEMPRSPSFPVFSIR